LDRVNVREGEHQDRRSQRLSGLGVVDSRCDVGRAGEQREEDRVHGVGVGGVVRDVPKHIDDAFYSGSRSEEVPLIINDLVEITAGLHAGRCGR
jgi:hypothetical protein